MAVGRGRQSEAEFYFVVGKIGGKGGEKSNKNERAIGNEKEKVIHREEERKQ